MECSLLLRGKKYVSARRGAKIAGYSSDYVGQLCRERKVLAHRSGKHWFVCEKSLLVHKRKQERLIQEMRLKMSQSYTSIADSDSDDNPEKSTEIKVFSLGVISKWLRHSLVRKVSVWSPKIGRIASKTIVSVLICMNVFGGPAMALSLFTSAPNVAEAAVNTQINYQGKLTDASGTAVTDGSYNMEFSLYTASSGGSAIWTETLTSGNRVSVSSGLFSVMLGAVTSLTSVDFNQTLYLGVKIGGSGATASWDSEMTPRKILGAVPAAFEARRLEGLSSSQFLRADAVNATSTASTFVTITQSGSGSALVVNGLTSLSNLLLSGSTTLQNFTAVNSTTTNATTTNLSVANSLSVTGTATSSFTNGLNITAGCFAVNGTCISGGGGGSGTVSLGNANSLAYYTGATTVDDAGALYWDNTNSRLGIGTSSPYATLSVAGQAVASYFTATTSTASVFPYASTTAISVSGNSYFSSLANFAGFISTASSTIGNGTQVGGLTVSGGATTTGNAYVGGNLTIADSSAPTTGKLYFGNAGKNLSYNSSDLTLSSGGFYTDAGHIVATGVNETAVLGVRFAGGNGTYFLGATTGLSPDLIFTNNGNLERMRLTDAGNLGIGTTTPGQKLSVAGDILGNNIIGSYFTATSTATASVFPYASTTALTISGTNGLQLATGLNGPLQANAGLVSATTSIGVLYGGTGLTSIASSSLLIGGPNNTFIGFATSSLGVALSDTKGTLAVSRGGTGLSAYTLGDVLYASGTGTLAGTSTANLKATLALNNVENTALSTWPGSTNITTLGTITSGTWNGTTIGVSKGGTGAITFSYGLISSIGGTSALTNIATSSLGLLSTDVAEGTNLYYTTTRFDNRLSATTSVASITTLANLATVGALTSGSIALGFGAISTGNAITTTGLGTFGNLLANGSSTLQNFTFVNATGTSATTTNFFATTASSTNLFSTNFTTGAITSGLINGQTISSVANFTGTLTATGGLATFSNASTTQIGSTGSAYFATTGGNVGIGTASPTYKLDIVDANSNGRGINISSTGGGSSSYGIVSNITGSATTNTGGYFYATGGTSNYSLQVDSLTAGANNYSIYANGPAKNYFAGNVGIGTTSPGQKLSVAGDILGNNIIGSYFTATSTIASVFPYASTTALSVSGASYFTGLSTLANLLVTGSSTLQNFTAANATTTNLVVTDTLSLPSTATGIIAYNTADQTTNYERVVGSWGSNIYNIATGKAGSGTTRNIKLSSGSYSGIEADGTNSYTYLHNQAIRIDTAGGVGVRFFGGDATGLVLQNNSGPVVLNNGASAGLQVLAGGGVTIDNAPSPDTVSTLQLNPRGTQLAPLLTASTFVVKNNGYVGVGTTSPYAQLSIAGYATGSTTLAIKPIASQTANILDVYNTSGVLTSVINSSGNFGIGTTSPGQKLSVAGDILGNNIIGSYFTATSTTASAFQNLTFTNATGTNATTTNFFATTASSTNLFASNLTVGGTVLTTSAGKVGIGTAAPFNLFSVSNSYRSTLIAQDITGISATDVGVYGRPVAIVGAVQSGNNTNRDILNLVNEKTGAYQGGSLNINFRGFDSGNGNNKGIFAQIIAGQVNGDDGAGDGYLTFGTAAIGATVSTERMRIDNLGNLGIGTTSPGQKLSVAGDILGNNIIGSYFTSTSTTASTFAGALTSSGIVTGSALVASSASATSTLAGGLAIETSGLVYDYSTNNVGIGTASPGAKLDVTGGTTEGVRITNTNETPFGLMLNNLTWGNTDAKGFGIVQTNAGGYQFWNNNITDFNVLSGGEVGIHITPVAGVNVNTGGMLRISSASDAGHIDFYSTTASASKWQQGLTGNDLYFSDPNIVRVTFQNGGNVGIGTTSPATTLSVGGNGYFTGGVGIGAVNTSAGTLTVTGTTTLSSTLNVTGLTTLGNASTTQIGSTGSAYFATTGGNVGIGTTSPASKLDVNAGLTDGLHIATTNEGPWGLVINNLTYGYGANKGFSVFQTNAGTSEVFNNGHLGLAVDTNGNVGIGTTSPATTLSVGGNGYFTGGVGIGKVNTTANTVDVPGAGIYKINGTNVVMASTTLTNFFFGSTPTTLYTTMTGANNVGVGTDALKINTTGHENTAVGVSTLTANTTGYLNTALGYGTLYSNTTGLANTAVGNNALTNNLGGGSNTAVGYNALVSNVSGFSNSAFGRDALHSNTADSNSAFGINALYANTSGAANVAVGGDALRFNVGGGSNSAIGMSALYSNTSGSRNTANGQSALVYNVTGGDNTAIGNQALANNGSATSSVAIGSFAGQGTANTSNQGGVYVGYKSGFTVGNSADYNTLVGYQAGYDITTGTNNLILGVQASAGTSITTGSNNILLGYDVRNGLNVTSSNQLNIGNLIFGTGLATGNTLSTGNVGIGTTSPSTTLGVVGNGYFTGGIGVGKVNTTANSIDVVTGGTYKYNGTTIAQAITATENYFFGNSGNLTASGSNNTAVGSQALPALTSGSNNTALGRATLNSNTTGFSNSVLGSGSLQSNTTGSNNSVVGFNAMVSNTTGTQNNAFGYQALYSNVSGTLNVAMGPNALYANTADSNVGIGSDALVANTSGTFNNAIGDGAISANTTGFRNVGIGRRVLQSSITGNNNTAIGNQALANNGSATSSVAIGSFAGQGTANTSNQGGVYVGFNSGFTVGNGADYNTFLGYQAGYDVTTGANNLILGQNAGDGTGVTTGSNNILIGNNVRNGLSQTGSSQLNIGNLIFGTSVGTGNTLSTGNVGIGSSTPIAKLGVALAPADNSGTQYGVMGVLTGGANVTSIAGYFAATGASTNYALKAVGLTDLTGNITTSGTINARSTHSSTLGNLFIGDNPGNGVYSSGHGGDIVFGGSSVGQNSVDATFANIRGIKENSTYSNSLGAIVFGTQSTSDSSGVLSTVTEKMRISSSGNVGIGTTSPYAALSVVGSTGVVAQMFTATSTTATTTIKGGLNVGSGALVYDFSSNVTSVDNLQLGTLSFATNAGAVTWNDMPVTSAVAQGTVESYTAKIDGSSLFTVYGESNGAGGTQNRAVGVATTSPWRTLSVVGTMAVNGLTAAGATKDALCLDSITKEVMVNTGAATCTVSSIRFKHDVENLNNGLSSILALRPVSFKQNSDNQEHLGFIAEEVALVDSRLIFTDVGTSIPRGVRYEELTAVLAKAIQEQQVEINRLASSTASSSTTSSSGYSMSEIVNQVISVIQSMSEFVVTKVRATLAVFDRVETNTASVANGIEFTDSVTGEKYCVTIASGEWNKRLGTCTTVNTVTTATTSATSTSGDSIAPIITINGNNPARIEQGTSYLDLGATVDDNVDHNLGATVTGDQIDTSVVGDYIVRYSATDQAGNHTEAIRTVTVFDPNASQTASGTATSTSVTTSSSDGGIATSTGSVSEASSTQTTSSNTTTSATTTEPVASVQ